MSPSGASLSGATRRGGGPVAEAVLDLGAEPLAQRRLDRDGQPRQQQGEQHEHGDDGPGAQRARAEARRRRVGTGVGCPARASSARPDRVAHALIR